MSVTTTSYPKVYGRPTKNQARDRHERVLGDSGVLRRGLQQLKLDVHDSVGQGLDLVANLSDDGL